MAGLDYPVREDGGYAIVELWGDIDLSAAPTVRKLLLAELQDSRGLLVDLAGISYIDSSGVACLVEAYQVARTRGQSFGLVGVSGGALGVLRLARLDTVFPIHASVAERLAADAAAEAAPAGGPA